MLLLKFVAEYDQVDFQSVQEHDDFVDLLLRHVFPNTESACKHHNQLLTVGGGRQIFGNLSSRVNELIYSLLNCLDDVAATLYLYRLVDRRATVTASHGVPHSGRLSEDTSQHFLLGLIFLHSLLEFEPLNLVPQLSFVVADRHQVKQFLDVTRILEHRNSVVAGLRRILVWF